MLGNVIYPLHTMLFGPNVYEIVLEMSSIVWFNSFWGAMSPQDLSSKAQDSVLSCGMGHRVW